MNSIKTEKPIIQGHRFLRERGWSIHWWRHSNLPNLQLLTLNTKISFIFSSGSSWEALQPQTAAGRWTVDGSHTSYTPESHPGSSGFSVSTPGSFCSLVTITVHLQLTHHARRSHTSPRARVQHAVFQRHPGAAGRQTGRGRGSVRLPRGTPEHDRLPRRSRLPSSLFLQAKISQVQRQHPEPQESENSASFTSQGERGPDDRYPPGTERTHDGGEDIIPEEIFPEGQQRGAGGGGEAQSERDVPRVRGFTRRWTVPGPRTISKSSEVRLVSHFATLRPCKKSRCCCVNTCYLCCQHLRHCLKRFVSFEKDPREHVSRMTEDQEVCFCVSSRLQMKTCIFFTKNKLNYDNKNVSAPRKS